jgi:hypothetical protein
MRMNRLTPNNEKFRTITMRSGWNLIDNNKAIAYHEYSSHTPFL